MALVETGTVEGSGWSDTSTHPWRRLIARLFDATFLAALFIGVLVALLSALPPSESVKVAIGVLALILIVPPSRAFVSTLLGALLLHWTSTTPGKWLCGIRVVRAEGGRMTYAQAFRREMEAYVRGCALFIPLIVIIPLIFGYSRLQEKGLTTWDERYDLIVLQRPNSLGQLALVALAFVLLAVALALLAAVMAPAMEGPL